MQSEFDHSLTMRNNVEWVKGAALWILTIFWKYAAISVLDSFSKDGMIQRSRRHFKHHQIRK